MILLRLFLLILLPLTLIGQNDLVCKDANYPITKVIDFDTVVLFTPTQEKCIYYWLDHCDVELHYSNMMIDAMEEHIDTLKSRIDMKGIEINLYENKSIIDSKRIINLEEQVKVEREVQSVYRRELKGIKKNRNKLYVIGGVLVTGLSTALIISIIN